MITATQRLAATAAGVRTDRVPIFCNLLDQGVAELGIPSHEYYTSGERVAEAQLRMREKYDYDNLWCLFYVGREAEMLGCKQILFAQDGPPNVAEWVINSPEDIRALEIPRDMEGLPAFAEILKCLALLRREAGGAYPICAYVTAPMAIPTLLMGMERWMELLLLGPSSLRDCLLEKCHEFFVREVRSYRAAGVDVILYSNPFGSTDVIPMRFFKEQALPWIKRDIAALGVTTDLVYYGGLSRINSVLADVLQATSIPAYYLGPMDDVAQARAALGPNGVLCGSINDIQLMRWTRQEVRDEVERLMRAGKPGGRFVFGTGLMPVGVPEEIIHTMLDAARTFGTLADSSSV